MSTREEIEAIEEVVEAELAHLKQALAEAKANAATDEEIERWRRGELMEDAEPVAHDAGETE